jgi:PEP-CTERM motif
MSRPTVIARLRATATRSVLAPRLPDPPTRRMSPSVRMLKLVSIIVLVGALHVLSAPRASASTILYQNFDDVTALAGWTSVNNSDPGGVTGWFQGNDAVFGAQEGAPDAYIAANFLNTGDGAISNWLILPELVLAGDETLTFYTRSTGVFPDRLEVRYSPNGTSTNVGSTAASVGDFTTLLLTINPTLNPGGYPNNWTPYSLSLLSLGATSGRLAFRYSIDSTLVNGDYIGIDTVTVSSSSTTPVPEPATLTLVGLGIGGLVARRRQRRSRA